MMVPDSCTDEKPCGFGGSKPREDSLSPAVLTNTRWQHPRSSSTAADGRLSEPVPPLCAWRRAVPSDLQHAWNASARS